VCNIVIAGRKNSRSGGCVLLEKAGEIIMEQKIGIVLLYTAMIVALGLVSNWSENIWQMIALGTILICGFSGLHLIRGSKQTHLSPKAKKYVERILIGILILSLLFLSFIIYRVIEGQKERKKQQTALNAYVKKYWDQPCVVSSQEWGTPDFDLKWKFTKQYVKSDENEVYVLCEWTIITHIQTERDQYPGPVIEFLDKDGFPVISASDRTINTARNQCYSGKINIPKKEALKVRTTRVKWSEY
jgi:hypothetical protein